MTRRTDTDAAPIPLVHCRWMIRRDLPEVLAVEAASWSTPWGEVDFLTALRMKNVIGSVAEVEERVVGFAVYEVFRDRFEMMDLAVAPAWRRQGVGRRMLARLAAKLHPGAERDHLAVTVRETNLPAQLFFRGCGLRAVEVLRGYYDDREDGYRMVRRRDS